MYRYLFMVHGVYNKVKEKKNSASTLHPDQPH